MTTAPMTPADVEPISEEFRSIPGYEDLYEISADGRLFAKKRTMLQDDSIGRRFFRTVERHEKVRTVNGRGYPAFNLHREGRQTCRLVSTLLRDTWGTKVAISKEPQHD